MNKRNTYWRQALMSVLMALVVIGLMVPQSASAHRGWRHHHCFNCFGPRHWRRWHPHPWRQRTVVYRDNSAAVGALALGVGLFAGAAIMANNQPPVYNTVVYPAQPRCFITQSHGQYYRVCRNDY